MRERAHEESFGDTRNAFNQGVVAGEDGDERFFDDFVLPDDDLGCLSARLR
jgi:hypothetical protein